MKKCLWIWLIWVLFALVSCAAAEGVRDDSANQRQYAREVAALGRFTLKDRGEGGGSCLVLARTDGTALDASFAAPLAVLRGPKACYTLAFATQAEAEAFVATARTMPYVRYAELDQPVRACEAEGSVQGGETALTFRSWAAEKMGFADLVRYAERVGARAVSVAVIDSGVYGHPLLAPRITRQGFDYVDQDYDSSNDGTGHGTHVSGIIVDCTPGLPVGIIPIRVLDNSGNGRIANVVNALREAITYAPAAINLSLAVFSHSDALHDAMQEALDAGITLVVSAGNHSLNVADICPAHMNSAGLVVVGAMDASGAVSGYSNYGSGVDVYAYGTDILSCSRSGGYITGSGTSMAAPHITAACAVLRMMHPNLGAWGVEQRIRSLPRNADLRALIPREWGFSLPALTLPVGRTLSLPTVAHPASCMETIRWRIADPAIANVAQGTLTALAPGETVLTASCPGFDPVTVRLTVTDAPWGHVTLGTAEIGAEAFAGDTSLREVTLEAGVRSLGAGCFRDCDGLALVRLPDGDIDIAPDAFPAEGTVFLCKRGTAADAWVQANARAYLHVE